MKKVLTIITIILIMFSFFTKSVNSEDKLKEIEAELEKEKRNAEIISKAINEISEAIEGVIRNKDLELIVLNQLENSVSRVAIEVANLEKEEERIRKSYNENTNNLENLSFIINESENKLNDSIFLLYKNYSLNYSAYFFSSKSFNEVMDKSIYLQYLLEIDKNNINKIKENKEKFTAILQNQVDDQVKLSSNLEEKKKKLEELSILEKDKEEEIYRLSMRQEQSESQRIQMIREQEETENKIKLLLKQQEEEIIRRKYKLTPMGPLIWPIVGYVSSGFGMRMHPIFGVNRLHTGIDIDSDYGVPIKSVQKGYVAYSGWLGGYGNTVIVQHDDKHSTLYAHMRSIDVNEKQDVNQGTILGRIGSTGWSTGPHLHFEVRIHGEPTDPLTFLP